MAGDDRRMRGYYQGRYRDNDVVSGQVEYRRKLNWRHGYVLWLGAGTLGKTSARWTIIRCYPRQAWDIGLK